MLADPRRTDPLWIISRLDRTSQPHSKPGSDGEDCLVNSWCPGRFEEQQSGRSTSSSRAPVAGPRPSRLRMDSGLRGLAGTCRTSVLNLLKACSPKVWGKPAQPIAGLEVGRRHDVQGERTGRFCRSEVQTWSQGQSCRRQSIDRGCAQEERRRKGQNGQQEQASRGREERGERGCSQGTTGSAIFLPLISL